MPTAAFSESTNHSPAAVAKEGSEAAPHNVATAKATTHILAAAAKEGAGAAPSTAVAAKRLISRLLLLKRRLKQHPFCGCC
jgi:hypothetical protein